MVLESSLHALGHRPYSLTASTNESQDERSFASRSYSPTAFPLLEYHAIAPSSCIAEASPRSQDPAWPFEPSFIPNWPTHCVMRWPDVQDPFTPVRKSASAPMIHHDGRSFATHFRAVSVLLLTVMRCFYGGQ